MPQALVQVFLVAPDNAKIGHLSTSENKKVLLLRSLKKDGTPLFESAYKKNEIIELLLHNNSHIYKPH